MDYIAVVISGKDFLWHRIERDEELIGNLASIEADFWNHHVIPGIMPEPDGSDSSEQFIREYVGNAHADKSIVLAGFDGQLKRRAEIMTLMDKLDTEKKTIEQKLKLFMGDAELTKKAEDTDKVKLTKNMPIADMIKALEPESAIDMSEVEPKIS